MSDNGGVGESGFRLEFCSRDQVEYLRAITTTNTHHCGRVTDPKLSQEDPLRFGSAKLSVECGLAAKADGRQSEAATGGQRGGMSVSGAGGRYPRAAM